MRALLALSVLLVLAACDGRRDAAVVSAQPPPANDPADANRVYLACGTYTNVRTPDGAIIAFDAPGAGTGPGQGTIPLSNNPVDAITGYYIDASDVTHGFLRTP